MRYELRAGIGNDSGGIPEGEGRVIEKTPQTELAQLLNELFVTNYTFRKGVNFSPLNKKVIERFDYFEEYQSSTINEIPGQRFGFTLDRRGYLESIRDFNEQFGESVKLEIIGQSFDKRFVAAKFLVNPEELGVSLFNLTQANGMPNVELRSTRYSYALIKDHYKYVDLILPSHLKQDINKKIEAYDPTKHKDSPTFILPFLFPNFSNELIQLYVSANMK